jgi:hypothetical protein
MNISALKHPSALIPLAMSFAALAMVVIHTAMYGVVHEADEGTPAHVFQLLMVAQIPIVAFFAIKWLPQNPQSATLVLALQIGAALVAMAPVFILKL